MVKVLSLPLTENVQSLYRLLQAKGIRLWVVEEAGRQVVYAGNEEQAVVVHEAYRRYREDQTVTDQVDQLWRRTSKQRFPQLQIWPVLLASPLVSLLLLSLILAGVWTGFGQFDSHRDFLIVDRYRFAFAGVANAWQMLMQILADGQFIRLLAPAWLHWSIMHWLFNSLGLWILGQSLEKYLGSFGLLLLVLFSAMVSNASQFLVSGADFGGFSGVVFALVGAHAIGLIVAPQKGCWAHPGLVSLSVIWMLAAMLGVTEIFGLHIANTAHFAGFVCGVVWVGVVLGWQAIATSKE